MQVKFTPVFLSCHDVTVKTLYCKNKLTLETTLETTVKTTLAWHQNRGERDEQTSLL